MKIIFSILSLIVPNLALSQAQYQYITPVRGNSFSQVFGNTAIAVPNNTARLTTTPTSGMVDNHVISASVMSFSQKLKSDSTISFEDSDGNNTLINIKSENKGDFKGLSFQYFLPFHQSHGVLFATDLVNSETHSKTTSDDFDAALWGEFDRERSKYRRYSLSSINKLHESLTLTFSINSYNEIDEVVDNEYYDDSSRESEKRSSYFLNAFDIGLRYALQPEMSIAMVIGPKATKEYQEVDISHRYPIDATQPASVSLWEYTNLAYTNDFMKLGFSHYLPNSKLLYAVSIARDFPTTVQITNKDWNNATDEYEKSEEDYELIGVTTTSFAIEHELGMGEFALVQRVGIHHNQVGDQITINHFQLGLGALFSQLSVDFNIGYTDFNYEIDDMKPGEKHETDWTLLNATASISAAI